MIKKNLNMLKVLANYAMATDMNTGPTLLEIEPVNYCNLNCLMCPVKEMVRKRGFMDLSLFKSIVDQTISTAWEYSFGVIGEPTLHPDLINMIEYIKSKDCKISLNTNLNYRDDTISEKLVENGVDRIIVTISGIDESMYKKINQKGDYHLVLHNLMKIKSIKKKLKKRKPTVIASFVKIEANREQSRTAWRHLRKYFDYCKITKMHDWVGSSQIAMLEPREKIRKNNKRCSMIYTTATILWDGRVAACCHDYEGREILGDTKSMTMNDIWNSHVKDFRKRYFNCDLCKNCSNEMKFQFSKDNIHYSLRTIL